MKAIHVIVEMKYKTEDGFVTRVDDGPVGEDRFIYSDFPGIHKMGKATIYQNGYNYPKLMSSLSGIMREQGESLFFVKDDWTYRLKRIGETRLA